MISSLFLTRTMFQVSPLLAASVGAGVFFCFLLFAFCFCGVHILRLAQKSNSPLTEKNATPKKTADTDKEKQPPSQEPVYYIVERKQRRSKPRYGEPKEFRFK